MKNPGSLFFVACTFSILAAEPRAAEPDAALRTDDKYASPREDQLVLDRTAYRNEGLPGGGLTDNDFHPKPSYKALDRRINHHWKTNLETRSDADGNVKFRGFNGTYEAEVTADGKTKKSEVTVSSGSPAKETLTMP